MRRLYVYLHVACHVTGKASEAFSLSAFEKLRDCHPRTLPETITLGVPQDICSSKCIYHQKDLGISMEIPPKEDFNRDTLADVVGDLQVSCRDLVVLSPTSASIQWNVTWTPPSIQWLEALGRIWPGVEIIPSPYTHLAFQESQFSWKAVKELFSDAFEHRRLKVPQACIQGRSMISLLAEDGEMKVARVTEELDYAQDLRRGVMRNRKCAQDLKLFLQMTRKPSEIRSEEWDDQVETSFLWMSVPGMGPLDIEPTSDGRGPAVAFVSVTFLSIVLFSTLILPQVLSVP